jgi:hypothetical protein
MEFFRDDFIVLDDGNSGHKLLIQWQVEAHDRALAGFAVDFKPAVQFFQARPDFGKAASVANLQRIEIIPRYQLQLTAR